MGIKKTYVCLNCEEEVTKENTSGKYCCNQCQQEYQSRQILEEWRSDHSKGMGKSYRLKNPVREYIFSKYNSQCCECGWNKINPVSGKTPLEIDHIDGDCTNNREENLRLLCPNCHALTPTYRALNIGKGNRKRLQYYGLVPNI